MKGTSVEETVIDLLAKVCADDPERIRAELASLGDAEIPSLFFLEIVGPIEEIFGVSISASKVHERVKSSFKNFCNLIEELHWRG
ncbi:acyl carrier protein [Ferroacidibacillus organovorans]|uniref:Carrier domain-containing protein n=1 Tax=Ferroacidibacillus organovorans TaxID=1765683 RepID=A0A1V4EW21_9BACL|nr:acyl carrier protein [Ferroacidibacillus organovorans]OPG16964.1 hypothetical protein B2M26_03915 [Ferroacidibacillus organovorans]